jgi:thymidine kinase
MSIAHIKPQDISKGNGGIYVITGGMKGRKTGEIIHFADKLSYAGVLFQAFKPSNDYRKELHEKIPKNHIVSRTGQSIPATMLDNEGDLSDLENLLDPKIQVYIFDEHHLFSRSNILTEAVLELRYNHGKTIVVGGLDRDFRGEEFSAMSKLISHATSVDKYFGICDNGECDKTGELAQRLVDGKPAHYDSPIIVVGASESYEIRCADHHEVPGKPEGKFKITFPEQQ